MSKVLVTLATEQMRELQEIAMPSLRRYADEHGYALAVLKAPSGITRPASWLKVNALAQALLRYDEALWVDADVVIIDCSADIADNLDDPSLWQAIAVHHTQDGEVPNCGVWYCRAPMRPVLVGLWQMHEYVNHPWWEQGAMLELLGYDSWARPVLFKGATELYKHTKFLSTEWNSHPWDKAERPRFQHATMYPDRPAVMREWAEQEINAR